MINVKVICENGVVLLASRPKCHNSWKCKRPGFEWVLPKTKNNEDVKRILSAIAVSDFGGVHHVESFKETDEDTKPLRRLKGGLEP